MQPHNSFRERREWSSSAWERKSLSRWSRYFRRRRADRAGMEGQDGAPSVPASPPRKTLREQYGISAMIYGLFVLALGLYFSATDVDRMASEQGYALDPIFRSSRPVGLREPTGAVAEPMPVAVPPVETFPHRPLRSSETGRSRKNAAPGRPPVPRRIRTEPQEAARRPVSGLPYRYLEEIGAARYVTPRNGA